MPLLPYWYGDFRYIHVGTLSTIAFLGTVAYAAVNYHLFNVRVLLKATFVYALLIAFALELYQLAVQALTRLLPLGDPSQRHVAAATLALILHAVTQQPLRGWLERLADRLLNVPHPGHHHSHKERHKPAVKAEDLPQAKGDGRFIACFNRQREADYHRLNTESRSAYAGDERGRLTIGYGKGEGSSQERAFAS